MRKLVYTVAYRISGYGVWRHQANDSVDDVVARWQESVPRHSVHCRRQRVHCDGFRLSSHSRQNRKTVNFVVFTLYGCGSA